MIVFNNDVTVIGDGICQETIISTKHFEDFGKLIEDGIDIKTNNIQSIEKSKVTLSKKLFQLQENGSTALGPGK